MGISLADCHWAIYEHSRHVGEVPCHSFWGLGFRRAGVSVIGAPTKAPSKGRRISEASMSSMFTHPYKG